MFCTTYNLEAFGKAVKKIRKELGLSQVDVKKAINISPNTLRRLEKGETIPTYDTIELLSMFYREDLLSILKSYKLSPSIYDIYRQIDEAIINQKSSMNDEIDVLINEIMKIKDQIHLVDYSHYEQLIVFLQLLKNSTLYDDELGYQHIEDLKSCLMLSIPDFRLSKLSSYNYNHIELRILLLIALTYKENKDYEQSTLILITIEKKISKKTETCHETIKILLKTIGNLSYIYYIVENIEASLVYANKGIAIAQKYDTNYILYSLYARRAIAKILLNQEDYLQDIFNSISLLDIGGKDSLKGIYIDVFKNKYGINIPFKIKNQHL